MFGSVVALKRVEASPLGVGRKRKSKQSALALAHLNKRKLLEIPRECPVIPPS